MKHIWSQWHLYFLIKPGFTEKSMIDRVIPFIKQNGFSLSLAKRTTLSIAQAETLYEEHRNTSKFQGLTEYMSSGPIIVVLGKSKHATDPSASIREFRKLMGADPSDREPSDTIRGRFGTSIRHNVVHAPDCIESRDREFADVISDLLSNDQ